MKISDSFFLCYFQYYNFDITVMYFVHLCGVADVVSFSGFPLIEASSQIQAGSLIEAGGRSKGEYTARLVGLPGISLCSNKYKKQESWCFKYMFISEPGGSNRSRVSNRSRGSDTISSNSSRGLLLEEIQYFTSVYL